MALCTAQLIVYFLARELFPWNADYHSESDIMWIV